MDRLNDEDIIDVECKRSGNVLDIEFIDNGSKIIINSQTTMREMWVAAKSGGFHYKHDGQAWHNTRDGSELFAALSATAYLCSYRAWEPRVEILQRPALQAAIPSGPG